MRARMTIGLTAGLLTALVLAPGVSADRVYHSRHITLEPVGGAPLKNGFVQNIHANGPNVYAHEIYKLTGAVPNASLRVRLVAYVFDPDCSGSPSDFGSIPLQTNGIGNGRADRFIRPSDAAGLAGTHGVRWEVLSNGTVLYATGCNVVTLD
jgi:hypothetical protein